MNREKLPRELLKISIFVYLGACILFLLGLPVHVKTVTLTLASADRFGDIDFFFGPYFIIQIICLILATVSTILLTCNYAKTNFPDKYSVISMIYNCIVYLITISLIHYLKTIGLLCPYPLLYLVPVITTVASLIFLFHDYSVKKRQDKGLAILETKPQNTVVKKRSTVKESISDPIETKPKITVKEEKEPVPEKVIIDENISDYIESEDPFTSLTKIANKAVAKEENKKD